MVNRVSTWVFDFYLSRTFQREHVQGSNSVLTGQWSRPYDWLQGMIVCLHLHDPPNVSCTVMTTSSLLVFCPSFISGFEGHVKGFGLVGQPVSCTINSKTLHYKSSFDCPALASGTPRTHFRTVVESDMTLGILGCFAAWGMIDVPPVIEGEMIFEKGTATLPAKGLGSVCALQSWKV